MRKGVGQEASVRKPDLSIQLTCFHVYYILAAKVEAAYW